MKSCLIYVLLALLIAPVPLSAPAMAQQTDENETTPQTFVSKAGVVVLPELSGNNLSITTLASRQRASINAQGVFSPVAVSNETIDVVMVTDKQGQIRASGLSYPSQSSILINAETTLLSQLYSLMPQGNPDTNVYLSALTRARAADDYAPLLLKYTASLKNLSLNQIMADPSVATQTTSLAQKAWGVLSARTKQEKVPSPSYRDPLQQMQPQAVPAMDRTLELKEQKERELQEKLIDLNNNLAKDPQYKDQVKEIQQLFLNNNKKVKPPPGVEIVEE